ncbi:MAG: acetyltransferase [Sphaerochaeta sp.]|nr:acetyltransferase [Sphaerochaeta sp.]
MSKKLLLLGAGGHCKSIIDTLSSSNEYSEIGIIEKEGTSTQTVLGIPVIGFDDDLQELYGRGFTHAFVSLGSIGDTGARRRLSSLLSSIGYSVPNIIDKSAHVSADCELGKGIFIGKNVVVNAGVTIGDYSIINTSATIEHDCKIGQFVHISTGTVLCGSVTIGNDSHIGANSVIRQQLEIGSNVMIGIGSVSLQNIPDQSTAYGNPCKVVSPR